MQQRNIGVHVLSEFIFCKRAGLNALLDDQPDEGRDPILRLDYQPCYEFAELEHRLERFAKILWQTGASTAGFFLAGVILGKFLHWSFFVGGFVATFILGRNFALDLIEACRLLRTYKDAKNAAVFEPLPHVAQDEPVNWWELRAAGFVSQLCDEPLVDPQIGLVGRPWRILRKGDISIPVFVRRKPDGALHSQQRARLEAYCHLLRINENANSPYGIVLDGGTFAGTAVKTSPSAFGRVRLELNALRSRLDTYLHHGLNNDIPEQTTMCSGCPHGRPRPFRLGESETTSLGLAIDPTVQESRVNRLYYHSSCGDRFGWIPSHDDAVSRGLRIIS